MTETNISTARVPQVTVIDPRIPEKAKLRVAAYARVSSDSEDQVNSYIAQVDFYSKHIAGTAFRHCGCPACVHKCRFAVGNFAA